MYKEKGSSCKLMSGDAKLTNGRQTGPAANPERSENICTMQNEKKMSANAKQTSKWN